MSLSEKKIQSLKPKKKAYRVSDNNGLYIHVSPTGHMSWQYRFHIYENSKRKEKIETIKGGYPTLSLKQARAEHRALRERVLKGEDVTHTKKLERKKKTVVKKSLQDIAEQWLERRKHQVSESSVKREWSALSQGMLSQIGTMQIADITQTDILDCALKVEKTVSNDKARRTIFTLGKVYELAMLNKAVSTNLTTGLVKFLGKKKKVEHYNSIETPDELGRWVYATENAYDSHDTIGCYCRILAHFGVRVGETLDMKWSEIDFKNKVWNYDVSKTLLYGVDEFKVYLTEQVIKILKDVQRLNSDKEYVFASYGKSGKITSKAVQDRMARLGFPSEQVHPYGFRSTLVTLGQEELGEREPVVDMCLAHKPKGYLGRTYNKAVFWKERKAFYVKWSDYLMKLKKDYQKTMIKVV